MTAPSALRANGIRDFDNAPRNEAAPSLATLEILTDVAISYWAKAEADAGDLSAFRKVQFQIVDLPESLLALAAPTIVWIDRDAAGFGWFVDSTPDTDEEFGLGGAASERMDLLTVLAHELGHMLGFEHHSEPGHLMSETLSSGSRLLPIGLVSDIDEVFANSNYR